MQQILKRLDDFQYTHRPVGFLVAVLQRYSRDNAGRQAALITYYLFLSLFPLLLILALFSNWLNKYNPGIANSLIHGATNYFPVLGQQLNIIAHSPTRSLAGILVAGLVALYGARGMAMAFITMVNEIWGTAKEKRPHFPASWLNGIAVVIIGGSGLVTTSVITSWALGHGQGNLFRLIIIVLSIILLTFVFAAILKISLPKATHVHRLFRSAVVMACALALLQLIGGFIVTHDLRHYTTTYTALFGTTLGLIAWIYIVAQILIYSIELTVIIDHREWPVHLIKD